MSDFSSYFCNYTIFYGGGGGFHEGYSLQNGFPQISSIFAKNKRNWIISNIRGPLFDENNHG